MLHAKPGQQPQEPTQHELVEAQQHQGINTHQHQLLPLPDWRTLYAAKGVLPPPVSLRSDSLAFTAPLLYYKTLHQGPGVFSTKKLKTKGRLAKVTSAPSVNTPLYPSPPPCPLHFNDLFLLIFSLGRFYRIIHDASASIQKLSPQSILPRNIPPKSCLTYFQQPHQHLCTRIPHNQVHHSSSSLPSPPLSSPLLPSPPVLNLFLIGMEVM